MNAKKVGRPKGTIETVGVYRRVPVELVEKIDGYLDAAIGSYRVGNLEAVDRWLKETYGFVGGREPVLEVKGPSEVVAVGYRDGSVKAEVKPLKNQANEVMTLLDDIQKLTDEVQEVKGQLEETRRMTTDQLGTYWKQRCLKAEDFAKRNSD